MAKRQIEAPLCAQDREQADAGDVGLLHRRDRGRGQDVRLFAVGASDQHHDIDSGEGGSEGFRLFEVEVASAIAARRPRVAEDVVPRVAQLGKHASPDQTRCTCHCEKATG